MSNASVPAFYTAVIHDVMEKMSRKFAEMGIDEHVLTELQQNWEERVRNSRVASFSQELTQDDGSSYMSRRDIDALVLGNQTDSVVGNQTTSLKLNKTIPQTDGQDDDDDEEEDDEPGDSDINSDLDDEDSEDENVETDHLILCQYEKVSRIKNKWKCVLKDGVVNINGKDYLFNKVSGLTRQTVTLNGSSM
jgi:hypothetical protein